MTSLSRFDVFIFFILIFVDIVETLKIRVNKSLFANFSNVFFNSYRFFDRE